MTRSVVSEKFGNNFQLSPEETYVWIYITERS